MATEKEMRAYIAMLLRKREAYAKNKLQGAKLNEIDTLLAWAGYKPEEDKPVNPEPVKERTATPDAAPKGRQSPAARSKTA